MLGTKSLMPFLAGLGAGVVAGILLAPEQGQRIRERVGKFAKQSADAVKERAENLSHAAGETLNSGAKSLRNSANDAVESATAKITNAADEFAQKSKRVEHRVGKNLEDAGKRLQEA